MAKKLDQRLYDILAKYHPNPRSALWDCHGVWVAYHKDIEIIAAAAGVKFDMPQIIVSDQEKKNVAILVSGSLNGYVEWSIGEAAPYNNKNAYPFSMAEKRGKDRVVLKLVGLHGFIYSEEEIEEKPAISDVKQEIAFTATETYPGPDDDGKSLKQYLAEIGKVTDIDVLLEWGNSNRRSIAEDLGEDDQVKLREAFSARKQELRAA